MPRLMRRIIASTALVVLVVYLSLHVYVWFNETAWAFAGAELAAAPRLDVDGRIPAPWDTLRVTTQDGVAILLLESWQLDAPKAPWIVFFYGREGRIADRWNIDRYAMFRQAGLNVLAVEYRGYGASEKVQPTEGGVYADARAAWWYMREVRGVPAEQVLLYGFSLGGGVAVQLAKEISPAGLVTEGAFTSGPAAARVHYPWLASAVVRNRFENLRKAQSLPTPWLIFHGRLDRSVPFAHAEALASTASGPRYLEPLDCGHNTALDAEGERMARVLKEFVGNVLGDASESKADLESG